MMECTKIIYETNMKEKRKRLLVLSTVLYLQKKTEKTLQKKMFLGKSIISNKR